LDLSGSSAGQYWVPERGFVPLSGEYKFEGR